MHKLVEYACEELEQLEKKAEKGNLSAAEIEYAGKLAGLKKDLLKGEMLYEASEDYSGDMMPMSYRGSSYASYARGRGRNARRDSMGRYSSERGYSRDNGDMLEQLEDLMESAPNESTRRDIEKLMHKVKNM